MIIYHQHDHQDRNDNLYHNHIWFGAHGQGESVLLLLLS